jgi:hypothetical protein
MVVGEAATKAREERHGGVEKGISVAFGVQEKWFKEKGRVKRFAESVEYKRTKTEEPMVCRFGWAQ